MGSRVRIDGVLPHNLDSERNLLGIMMASNSVVFEIADIVQQADFFAPAHGELFILIRDQVNAGRPANALTLLHDMQQDRAIGGERPSVFLRTLQETAPPADIGVELARNVRDLAIRRQIIGTSEEAIQRALDAPVTVTAEELRSEFDGAMAGLYRSIGDLGLRRLSDVNEDVIREFGSTKRSGVSVGLKAVEDLTGPFQPGRVYTLAAMPAAGKSALAQQIAQNVARDGALAILFSPEMNADEIGERSLASATGLASEDIESGQGNFDDVRRLREANDGLRNVGLVIDDIASPSVAMIRNRVQRMQAMGRVVLVVIDHVLYLSPPNSKTYEADAVDQNMRAIKRMAKDLAVPVLALTQFTTEGIRELNKWPHPRPNVGHMLYAGIFDRHSDVILILHREEAVLARNRPETKNAVDHESRLKVAHGLAELILTKARGRKGDGQRMLTFDAKRLRFSDDVVQALWKEAAEIDEPLFVNGR